MQNNTKKMQRKKKLWEVAKMHQAVRQSTSQLTDAIWNILCRIWSADYSICVHRWRYLIPYNQCSNLSNKMPICTQSQTESENQKLWQILENLDNLWENVNKHLHLISHFIINAVTYQMKCQSIISDRIFLCEEKSFQGTDLTGF